MPFAPVKSDPWKKGQIPKRNSDLWPHSFWKKLCEQAQADKWFFGFKEPRVVSPDCLEMIGDMNQRMYGKR